MSLLKAVRTRRLLPFMGAYLVTGFVVLEGMDQLVSHEILPEVAYRIALAFYLFGIPGSLIVAWFHGEKGRQEIPRAEIWLQAALLVLAAGVSIYLWQNQPEAVELAAEDLGLDPSGVAVLYFDDLSPGGELGYVADGLTEALIDRLSQVRSLEVVSRNGVAQFRESEVARDSIARALEVGSLIAGSVEQVGDRLRVTTRLVDGNSGADIERTSLELEAGDFLVARDSVAERVSRSLRQRLGEEVRLRERKAGTASVEAWSLVSRAERLRKEAEQLGEAGDLEGTLRALAGADSLLALAEVVDSTWAQPPILRAHAAFRNAYFTATRAGDHDGAAAEIEKGLAHAERALALAPNDPAALEQRGSLTYLLWLLDVTHDADEAARLLDRAQADLEAAVRADPTLATAHSTLSHLYVQRQDNVSVVLAGRRAYEEDAYLRNADQITLRLFWGHYNLEQFTDAGRWCEEGARRFPEDYQFVKCGLWLAASPAGEADVQAAWALKARLDSLAPEQRVPYEDRFGYLLVGGVLRNTGLTDSAESVFAQGEANEEIDPLQELVSFEAAIRATTGDPDGAMELLRRYVAANPGHSFEEGGNIHWWWSDLSTRPDFQALVSH